PLWLLTGQRAHRLDGDCASRPWLIRPLAVYHDSSAGLASLLAHQSSRPLSGARLRHLSAPNAGSQLCRAAVGWPGPLLCHPSAATRVHPPGALGCGVSRPLVDPHRPAADCGRCRVVWVTRLDRVRVQRQQTRRLALGTDQDAGARSGRAALARLGGGDLMDRQGGLPGRSRATPAPVDPTPRAAYCPQAGYRATPGAHTQVLPAWPDGHPGRALSGAALAGGVYTPRTVAEQPRDGSRPAPCLSTATQSGIREKPTLERGGPLHVPPEAPSMAPQHLWATLSTTPQ